MDFFDTNNDTFGVVVTYKDAIQSPSLSYSPLPPWTTLLLKADKSRTKQYFLRRVNSLPLRTYPRCVRKPPRIQQELLGSSEDLRTSKKVLLREFLTQIVEERNMREDESLKNKGED